MQNEKVIYVQGMSCENCRKHVHQALISLDGVESLEVDLASGRVNMSLSKNGPSDAQIKSALENAGYQMLDSNLF